MPISQNGQAHSNNLSAICWWIVWVCLTIGAERVNKLKVSCFIYNWFSLKYFKYKAVFYPNFVINKLRFNWFQQW